MADGAPVKQPRRKRKWLRGVLAVATLVVAIFGLAWWIMIRMPSPGYPHYHHPEDTIDKVDFDRMARVVRGLERVVAELAGAE